MKQKTQLFPFGCLLAVALPLSMAMAATGGSAPFPTAVPEDVGMSSEKLREGVESVKNWVEAEQIVGAVILVVRHGKLVLHEAIGWNDKEKKAPLTVESIFRMRSMTKPLIGTAILMLVEQGRILLDDKVSQYLPSFDNSKSKDITVFQLLTHTSGLTGDIYDNLKGTRYASLREAVDDVGRMGPSFKPGTDYHYSDPGSSTLGALIAEISGMPAEDFIQKRILDPLLMKDSFCNLRPDDPRKLRVASTYLQDSGKWKKYWDNSQPQLIPFFRASGGLYSTALDYAKFMNLMLQGGRVGSRQLISPSTVKVATSPHSTCVYDPARLREKYDFYGLQWSVYTDKYRSIGSLASAGSFGHGGSDGTLAWADPQQDLIVIYLSQSRGDPFKTRARFLNMVYSAIIK